MENSPFIAKQSSSQSSSAAAPGADTSINSVSSTHSYSSLNSSTQGYSTNIREGTSIVSNSILNNAVNQSIANNSAGGGGLNSNDSFFAVKQSNISRGISANLLTTSPRANPVPQQDRVPSNNTSPSTSGSITRPPMSSQRPRDNKVSGHIPSLANTSFSSASSPDASMTSGSVAQSVTPMPLEPPQDTPLPAQGSVSSVTLSAAKGTPLETTTLAIGAGSIAKSTPGASSTGAEYTSAVTVSSASAQQQSQHRSQQNNGSSSSHHGSHGHDRSHGRQQTESSSSASKHRARTESGKDAPRPSATVSPAPIPAMHWTRAKVHGQIPPKDLRAQTVNLVGESVYVFGGCDPKNCFNTLYIFDADTMHWSQPKTYGSIPPPCRAHSSTLVDNKRLYVFGGGDGPQYFNELYMLDTDTLTWTNPQTTGKRPRRRRAHTTCVYNNCIYVFGGGDGVQALNDTFQLNLADMHWTELKTTGAIPISRGYHTSNLIKNHFIVYGGSDGHECFSDVHVLDLDTKEWTKIDISRPLSRLSHTATQVGSYLFVIGGHDGSRYSCDVMMLNLVTWSWETRKVYGIPPAGRGYHASLLYDSRLFMFGGYDGQTVFDDIYILDLSTCAYLPQITDFQILLRRDYYSSESEEGNQSIQY
ncbi:hypothetical protein BGZ95_003251 [Linnemannia exigua]|uniref:Galactose oxidase n=1 Tax=Linnemannia exigua TaxID=604196 RepID=A0AAD4DIB7_9FUNG|nr:hypothetical protein BGZ95_003251 [Linnemannia exigua]